MTLQEQASERDYRTQERLGILLGDAPATPAQAANARAEATVAVSRIVREDIEARMKKPVDAGRGMG